MTIWYMSIPKLGALCFANYHPMNAERALKIKKGEKLVLFLLISQMLLVSEILFFKDYQHSTKGNLLSVFNCEWKGTSMGIT